MLQLLIKVNIGTIRQLLQTLTLSIIILIYMFNFLLDQVRQLLILD